MAINVQYDELVNARSTLASGRDAIFQELDGLRNRIQNLVSSGFVTDRTSGAFHDAYQRYSDGAKNTVQGLDQVIEFLQKVENTLRETDAQLAASIG